MAKVALGYLGWSEKQALSADVNSILIGWEGRSELITSCYEVLATIVTGKSPEVISEKPVANEIKAAPLNTARFDNMFGDGPSRGVS